MKTKIASLELGRIIAMLAIIGLHCQMALTYWQIDDIPWVATCSIKWHALPYRYFS